MAEKNVEVETFLKEARQILNDSFNNGKLMSKSDLTDILLESEDKQDGLTLDNFYKDYKSELDNLNNGLDVLERQYTSQEDYKIDWKRVRNNSLSSLVISFFMKPHTYSTPGVGLLSFAANIYNETRRKGLMKMDNVYFLTLMGMISGLLMGNNQGVGEAMANEGAYIGAAIGFAASTIYESVKAKKSMKRPEPEKKDIKQELYKEFDSNIESAIKEYSKSPNL